MFLLRRKTTDLHVNNAKIGPHKTLDFKLTKSRAFFSLSTPLDLEMQKKMIVVTSLELHNLVSKIFKRREIYTILTPGFWEDPEIVKGSHEEIGQK